MRKELFESRQKGKAGQELSNQSYLSRHFLNLSGREQSFAHILLLIIIYLYLDIVIIVLYNI